MFLWPYFQRLRILFRFPWMFYIGPVLFWFFLCLMCCSGLEYFVHEQFQRYHYTIPIYELLCLWRLIEYVKYQRFFNDVVSLKICKPALDIFKSASINRFHFDLISKTSIKRLIIRPGTSYLISISTPHWLQMPRISVSKRAREITLQNKQIRKRWQVFSHRKWKGDENIEKSYRIKVSEAESH